MTLSSDEYALLMIMDEGGAIADIGNMSRWSAPLRSLIDRGLVDGKDKFNCVITPTGRAKLAENTKQEDEAFATVARKDSPLGPSVVNGQLFFNLGDKVINCHCIGEPYASRIVDLWRNR